MRKFRSVCLITQDVQRLKRFYESVLQVKGEGEGDFAELRVGDSASLTLFSRQGMEQMAPGSMSRGRIRELCAGI